MEVLLGLLTVEPMSGYDLGQAVRDSIGHFWNESYGQIYPNLKRMAASGLIAGKAGPQQGRHGRQVYSITRKGRERLAAWLAVEPQPEVSRNELLLKLFFGVQATPQVVTGFVERMAESERRILERFGELETEIARLAKYPDAPYWRMALRFGQIELEAHQRWAKETLAELRRLSKKRPPSAPGKAEQYGSK
ncbi:MAG TPA: PadR family transcriptional regulator [Candidatus Sulfotelmatobacter sp.]